MRGPAPVKEATPPVRKVGGCGYGLRQPVHGSHRTALRRGAPHQRDKGGVQVQGVPLRPGDQPLTVPRRPQLCRAGRDRQRGGERGRRNTGQPASEGPSIQHNAAVVSRTSGRRFCVAKAALQLGCPVQSHVWGWSRLSSCQWKSRAKRQCPSAAEAPGWQRCVCKLHKRVPCEPLAALRSRTG